MTDFDLLAEATPEDIRGAMEEALGARGGKVVKKPLTSIRVRKGDAFGDALAKANELVELTNTYYRTLHDGGFLHRLYKQKLTSEFSDDEAALNKEIQTVRKLYANTRNRIAAISASFTGPGSDLVAELSKMCSEDEGYALDSAIRVSNSPYKDGTYAYSMFQKAKDILRYVRNMSKTMSVNTRTRSLGDDVLGGPLDALSGVARKSVPLGPLLLGGAGWMFGGPVGAAIGGSIGYWLSRR